MRTFIAIELPENIKADIFHKFEDIQEAGLVGGNFVDKSNLHLTLKFLGDISEEQVEKINKKLSEINFKKFDAKIGKIGFFPDENYIKVVWIELLSEEIIKLQKIVEDKMDEIGLSKETKEFQPHLTIARVQKLKNKDLFFEKVKKINIKKSEFEINKFSFIKSELTRSGPIYRIIKDFNLK